MNQPLPTVFFYGTLMNPDLIRRVTKTNGTHLEIAPAILKKFTRHQVKVIGMLDDPSQRRLLNTNPQGESYPAVISYIKAKELMDRELEQHERSVRGVVVKNFTKMDNMYLDFFEGISFEPRKVFVYPLGPFKPLVAFSTPELLSPDLTLPEELPEPVPANCYMWRGPISWLKPEVWSFEAFLLAQPPRYAAMPLNVTVNTASESGSQSQEEAPTT